MDHSTRGWCYFKRASHSTVPGKRLFVDELKKARGDQMVARRLGARSAQ